MCTMLFEAAEWFAATTVSTEASTSGLRKTGPKVFLVSWLHPRPLSQSTTEEEDDRWMHCVQRKLTDTRRCRTSLSSAQLLDLLGLLAFSYGSSWHPPGVLGRFPCLLASVILSSSMPAPYRRTAVSIWSPPNVTYGVTPGANAYVLGCRKLRSPRAATPQAPAIG